MTPPASGDIERALSRPLQPGDLALPALPRIAAVAVILGGPGADVQLCLGRRRPFAGDPWSGDIAFPGGKAQSGDRTLHDVAARETAEETGLDLTQQQLAGVLGIMLAHAGDNRPPLQVHPMIYRLKDQLPVLAPSMEFAEASWVPLSYLWDRRNWITFTYPGDGLEYAGIRHGGHTIWGFTLRAIVGLSERCGHSLVSMITAAELPYLDHTP